MDRFLFAYWPIGDRYSAGARAAAGPITAPPHVDSMLYFQ